MMASRVERYCCGCGLCSGVCDHLIDARGYYRPTSDPEESGFDTSVCYCNSLTGAGNPSAPWGPLLTACYSWSSNPDVRHAASSGGTLTALCAHLLRNGMVDGVVQVSTDPEDPMRTTTVVSETPDEVLACAGSRYTAYAHGLSAMPTGKIPSPTCSRSSVGEPRRHRPTTGCWPRWAAAAITCRAFATGAVAGPA